jgi:type IV pilus assembly protein PilM
MAGRTAIGLDIGTSVVRAVELSFGRGGITLERFGQVVLPEGVIRDGEVVDPEPVTGALRQLWAATGFSHKRVVLGVANQRVIVRKLTLPWLERAELRASLPYHVEQFLPIPLDQALLDFYPIEETTDAAGVRSLHGLLVAAARESVLANINCVQAAGLTTTSVDLTSFAVLRSLGKQTQAEVETEALIDIGARVTNVVIHSGGVPRFVRIVLMGGQDITDAVAGNTGLSAGEAELLKYKVGAETVEPPPLPGQWGGPGVAPDPDTLVRQAIGHPVGDFIDEIRQSLDYYAVSGAGAPVERILVSGGGSRLTGLAERLSAATRLPVRAGDPMANLRIGNTGLDADQLEFVRPLAAVPVGLALGAM